MNSDKDNLARTEDGIDLVALWRVVWRYRYFIFLTACVGAAIAAIFALIAVPTYRAEVVISEVRDRNMGSGLASQLGGLASLAGVNLGGTAGSESQAILKSRRLVEEFIQRNAMLKELGTGSKGEPTLWLAVKRFKERMITIREDKLNGLTTIAIDGPDPAITAQRANAFVVLANELIRDRAINNAKQNVAYLNEQLTHTNEVELRRVLYNLIENETKTLMLANAHPEYAFTVVDPAVPPEVRMSPRRTLMVFAGLLIGAFIGVAFAFVHQSMSRYRRQASHKGQA